MAYRGSKLQSFQADLELLLGARRVPSSFFLPKIPAPSHDNKNRFVIAGRLGMLDRSCPPGSVEYVLQAGWSFVHINLVPIGLTDARST